jgi:replicative DNA helicase
MTNQELSAICIGQMIRHPETTWDRASTILSPGMFADHKHMLIHGAILSMLDKGEPVDQMRLAIELGGKDVLVSDLTELADQAEAGSAANFEFYATQLADNHRQRIVKRIGAEVAEKIKAAPGDALELMEEGLVKLQEAGDRQKTTEDEKIAAVAELLADIDWSYSHPGELSGITTNIQKLDRLTHGMQPTSLILICGYTSAGKSAICAQLAIKQAARGIPVAFYTLEMTTKETVLRMAAQLYRINSTQLRYPSSPGQSEDSRRYVGKIGEIKELYIHEAPGVRLADLLADIRTDVRRNGVKVVYVDYLSLVSGSVRKDGARYLELGEITQALRNLAKTLKITIVSAAQLGKDAGDRTPRLRDIRESHDIALYADIVLLMYRAPAEQGNTNVLSNSTDLIIAKNRNGPLGTIKMEFHPGYFLFEENEKCRT